MNTPIAPPAHDWVIAQDWSAYTPLEHVTWDRLAARQGRVLKDRATPTFLQGVTQLGLDGGGVPNLEKLSDRLMRLTGWRVVAVPGLSPAEDFFRHLANRTFVAGRFIRTPQQFDYLEEPDIFHDVYGHTPLLADPVFADYLQAYGEGGLRAARLGALDHLARLYWYTVEFGLIRDPDGLKLYGAGIVSSAAESVFALEDPSPNRIGFDLQRIMRTRYEIDDFQRSYFVIDSFEDLLAKTLEADFAPVYHELETQGDLEPDVVTPSDAVFWRGTQARKRAARSEVTRENSPTSVPTATN